MLLIFFVSLLLLLLLAVFRHAFRPWQLWAAPATTWEAVDAYDDWATNDDPLWSLGGRRCVLAAVESVMVCPSMVMGWMTFEAVALGRFSM